MCKPQMILKNIMPARHKRIHKIWPILPKILRWVRLIYQDRKQISDCLEPEVRGNDYKETQGDVFGGLEILYILIRMQLITHVYTIIKTYTGQLK